jgi:hypothetical protein
MGAKKPENHDRFSIQPSKFMRSGKTQRYKSYWLGIINRLKQDDLDLFSESMGAIGYYNAYQEYYHFSEFEDESMTPSEESLIKTEDFLPEFLEPGMEIQPNPVYEAFETFYKKIDHDVTYQGKVLNTLMFDGVGSDIKYKMLDQVCDKPELRRSKTLGTIVCGEMGDRPGGWREAIGKQLGGFGRMCVPKAWR